MIFNQDTYDILCLSLQKFSEAMSKIIEYAKYHPNNDINIIDLWPNSYSSVSCQLILSGTFRSGVTNKIDDQIVAIVCRYPKGIIL